MSEPPLPPSQPSDPAHAPAGGHPATGATARTGNAGAIAANPAFAPAPERGRRTLLILAGAGLFALGAIVGYQLRFSQDLADTGQVPQQLASLGGTPPAVSGTPGPGRATPPTPAIDTAPALASWDQAETLFGERKFAEAQAAYTEFKTKFGMTQLYTVNAATLADRLAVIGDELHPQPKPGLIGWYFTGRDFSDEHLLIERIDGPVDFAWGGGQPAAEVPADGFCVRWVGTLKVKQAGHYVLATVTDDGTRLKLDGKLIIEQWVDQADTRVAAELDLTAGDHRIEFDMYENGGGATARLFWALQNGFEETLIPNEALWHNPQEMKHPPARPTLGVPHPATDPNNDDHF